MKVEMKAEQWLKLAETDPEAIFRRARSLASLDEATRAQVALTCAQVSGFHTARNIEKFNLTGENLRFQIACACTITNGFAVRFIKQFSLSEENRIGVARLVSKQIGLGLPQFMRQFEISDPAVRFELACACARIDGYRTARHMRNFQLKDEAQKKEVGLLCAASEPRRTALFLRNFTLKPGNRMKIAMACMSHNLASCKEFLPEETQTVCRDAGLFEETISESLRLGHVTNALNLIATRKEVRGDSNRSRAHCIAELDQILAACRTGSGEIASLAAHMLNVRESGVLPTDAFLKASRAFPGDQPFLLGILKSHGESYGSSICQALVEIFPAAEEIPHNEKVVVKKLLATGFGGFSKQSYTIFRELSLKSETSAAQIVSQWKGARRQILGAEDVEVHVVRDPLYAEFIHDAYRPIGIGLQEIEKLIKHVEGHPEHLAPYTFKREGYEIRIGTHDVVLKPGMVLEEKRIEALLSPLISFDATTDRAAIGPVLGRFSKGAVLEGDQIRVLGYLFQHGTAVQASVSHIQALTVAQDRSLPGTYHTLVALEELLLVSLRDDMHSCAHGLQIALSSAGTIRSVAASESQSITETGMSDPATLSALLRAVEQSFASDIQFIRAEKKKFMSATGKEPVLLNAYFTKAQPAFFARASSRLCTAKDFTSWEDPNFLQLVLIDQVAQRVCGNVQLHRFSSEFTENGLLIRFNPNLELATKVDQEALVREVLVLIDQFCADNSLEPYLPMQTDWHELTNRVETEPALVKFYEGQAEPCDIQIADNYSVQAVYKLGRQRLLTAPR